MHIQDVLTQIKKPKNPLKLLCINNASPNKYGILLFNANKNNKVLFQNQELSLTHLSSKVCADNHFALMIVLEL